MTTWFTSDTHFGHTNIIRYSNRPFKDVNHMNEQIIERWNALVAPEDTVFHLGDVALGKIDDSLACVGRLNGYKVLVDDGNHDRPFMSRGKAKYDYWVGRYAEVFQEIRPAGQVRVGESVVNISHYPYDGEGDHHKGGDRYASERLPDGGRILVHGHTHAEWAAKAMDSRVSRSKAGTLQIHVGMDAWHYKPVSEDRVIELIKENS
jgi:calcineurin-like phosphoesterase family protein